LTTIEWTDATWNPVTGCDRVSPGCAHCYALDLAARLKAMGQPRYQRDGDPRTSGPGFGVTLHPDKLVEPLRWRKPRMVFVNSMSDLFHEEIPYEFIREVFNVMRRCNGEIVAATGKPNPAHTFQVLTKRPEQALALWRERKLGFETWPPNVWLGVSIENARYTWRADVLREIPAAVRFISAEPLLGSLFPGKENTCEIDSSSGSDAPSATARAETRRSHPDGATSASNTRRAELDLSGIDWLIVGGESGGRQARPMHPQWARELRDACTRSDVDEDAGHFHGPAFFFKQWGSWAPERPEHFGGVPTSERTRRLQLLLPNGKQASNGPDPTEQLAATWMFWHGAAPKSGGRLLDGREWNEMPPAVAA
jgi:protein gp37